MMTFICTAQFPQSSSSACCVQYNLKLSLPNLSASAPVLLWPEKHTEKKTNQVEIFFLVA